MVVNSVRFLLFFIVVFTVYYLPVSKKYPRFQNLAAAFELFLLWCGRLVDGAAPYWSHHRVLWSWLMA